MTVIDQSGTWRDGLSLLCYSRRKAFGRVEALQAGVRQFEEDK